jgi:multiple sugar transport system substrate-binding protein
MARFASLLFLLLYSLAPCFARGAAEPRAAGPVALTIWTHVDPNRTRIEERYIEEFVSANHGVKVRRLTYASDQLSDLVQTAFAANQGPDIFNLQIEEEYPYIASGKVAPVNPRALGFQSLASIYDNYLPNVLDPVTRNGALYGLPLEVTNWCLYVNKKVFRSAGLDPERSYPRTWEDMVRISERLVIRDGTILKRRGFDFRYPSYLVEFMPMVEQLGGRLMSDDGRKAIVNDAAWLKFLAFMKEWGPTGKNLGSPTYTASRALFNADANDIAMTTSGLYQEGRIKTENPAFYASGEWMVVPFPVFRNAVREVAECYYGNYCLVNAQNSAAERDMAWKLVGYMLGHGEEYLSQVNIVQPRKSLLESAQYKAMPFAEVFTRGMERAHVVYYGANSAKLQKAIRTAVEAVMLSGATPEKALAALRAEAQEILDEQ